MARQRSRPVAGRADSAAPAAAARPPGRRGGSRLAFAFVVAVGGNDDAPVTDAFGRDAGRRGLARVQPALGVEIGRASCRELALQSVYISAIDVSFKNKSIISIRRF